MRRRLDVRSANLHVADEDWFSDILVRRVDKSPEYKFTAIEIDAELVVLKKVHSKKTVDFSPFRMTNLAALFTYYRGCT